MEIFRLENKKKGSTTGMLILPILGLAKFKKILSAMKSSKFLSLKDKIKTSLKLNSCQPMSMISTTAKMTNWENRPIWAKNSSRKTMRSGCELSQMSGMLENV
jgi:hypothetical protein